ncbi:MAG: 7-carboxy-7-deazaguanine synthase QueE [Parabacteroides sp.]|nr:7-carboxy-7-deazaguanine synthase QueE [Parabacteroides sp.]
MKTLPVVELFHSIQGEGMFTGVPSLFLRVTGCNLRCVFKNSICDTSYTSFNPDSPIFNNMDEVEYGVRSMLKDHPHTKHLVITGGEPMLYKAGVTELLGRLGDLKLIVTVETNGTMGLIQQLNKDGFNPVNLYSVSPKLSTSVDKACKFLTQAQSDHHDKIRIDFNALASFFIHPMASEAQLKFVYSGEDSVKEIKNIIDNLNVLYKCNITVDQIRLMPEASEPDQLDRIQKECAEVCLKEGWTFCDRLHLRIWGNKRCV